MKKSHIGIIWFILGIGFGFGARYLIDKCGCCNAPESEQTESLVAVVADGPNIDIASLPVDADGFITLFNGENLDGWRGYGMDVPPTSWEVSDGAIHYSHLRSCMEKRRGKRR